jgi:hypothetical protein
MFYRAATDNMGFQSTQKLSLEKGPKKYKMSTYSHWRSKQSKEKKKGIKVYFSLILLGKEKTES